MDKGKDRTPWMIAGILILLFIGILAYGLSLDDGPLRYLGPRIV